MNEDKVREILGRRNIICANDGLNQISPHIAWHPKWHTEISLDGDFTADELEAMAWWMKNKAKKG